MDEGLDDEGRAVSIDMESVDGLLIGKNANTSPQHCHQKQILLNYSHIHFSLTP